MEERGENPVRDGDNPVSFHAFLPDPQHKLLEAFSFTGNFVRPNLQCRSSAFGTYCIAAYQYSSLFVGIRIVPIAEVADYFVFTRSRVDDEHFNHPFLGEGFPLTMTGERTDSLHSQGGSGADSLKERTAALP